MGCRWYATAVNLLALALDRLPAIEGNPRLGALVGLALPCVWLSKRPWVLSAVGFSLIVVLCVFEQGSSGQPFG